MKAQTKLLTYKRLIKKNGSNLLNFLLSTICDDGSRFKLDNALIQLCM